jgi:hypothetical protein
MKGDPLFPPGRSGLFGLARCLLMPSCMMKLVALSALLSASMFASTPARAEVPRAEANAMFEGCVQATERFAAAPKALDLDLLSFALDGAEKGNEQCAGLAQRMLLQHTKSLNRMSANDRARVEAAYARGFALFGTPSLKIAQNQLLALVGAR